MENNNTNDVVADTIGKKKNNLIVIVALIVLALIIVVVLKNGNRKVEINPEQQPLSQTDIDLNQAVKSDTTTNITDNLNSINVDDTTDADLNSIDQELNKL